MTERFEQFSLTISELYYFLHRITRDEMEKYGLSGPHAIYFFILSRHKKGITAAELSDISFKNKADVSRAITLFEKKGLVKRNNSTKNSYRAKITLTEEGALLSEKLRIRAKIVTEGVDKGLSDEKRAELYDALGIIASNMKKFCDFKN